MPQLDDNMKRTGRREFLARVSAAAAAGVLLGDGADGAEAHTMPTIKLGDYRVSRLIVGSNPISGYSYLGPDMDRQMKEYFTAENTLDLFERCQQAGINTHQCSPTAKTTEVYRTMRRQGSKMQLIGLHGRAADLDPMIKDIGPIGVAHHGGVTDRLFRDGKSEQVRDFTKAVRDRGLLVGVSAHNPDCIKQVADEDWDVDFFMTCLYYLTRKTPPADPPPELKGPDVGYKFYDTDPATMCKVVRQVKQPCLAFKILGAGRRCASQETVRQAFRFTFENIKPTDGVIVGIYPRRFDQVKANANYTG